MNVTMSDVLELDFAQLEFFSERISLQRQREAQAIKNASRRK